MILCCACNAAYLGSDFQADIVRQTKRLETERQRRLVTYLEWLSAGIASDRLGISFADPEPDIESVVRAKLLDELCLLGYQLAPVRDGIVWVPVFTNCTNY